MTNSATAPQKAPERYMYDCCRTPWDTYLEPIKMAPGVYYVSGNNWVACYLIDTGDGLILIDTAMHETAYLLLENLRLLGYRPTDIKKILLSHAHIDHIGGAKTLQALTGATLYLGRRDLEYLGNPALIPDDGSYTCGAITPDFLYEDVGPITQGSVTIDTIPTPGHTPGCTSFFFDVTDARGKRMRCGMHGGLGLNTLSKEYFARTGQPARLREEYIQGLKDLDKLEVDIALPSHTNQVDILSKRDQITDLFNPYVDPTAWHTLMRTRLESVQALIASEQG